MDWICCQIVRRDSEAAIFWENDDFMAVLDLFPNVHGQALLISSSITIHIYHMPDNAYEKFFSAARQVSNILKVGLPVYRVAMVLEGMGINHAHIKLYPLHGLDKTFHEMWAEEMVFFEKYTGYITTQIGPKADLIKLKELSAKLSDI